jgi:hypothetical protein
VSWSTSDVRNERDGAPGQLTDETPVKVIDNEDLAAAGHLRTVTFQERLPGAGGLLILSRILKMRIVPNHISPSTAARSQSLRQERPPTMVDTKMPWPTLTYLHPFRLRTRPSTASVCTGPNSHATAQSAAGRQRNRDAGAWASLVYRVLTTWPDPAPFIFDISGLGHIGVSRRR